MHEPALAHAVAAEPLETFVEQPDPRPRRKDLDDEIGRTPDAIRHDVQSRPRDEDDVGLNDERLTLLQNDVDRR